MKKLWKNNQVLVLLFGVLLLCLIAIIVVAISFLRPTGSDPRLKDIKDYKISQKVQDAYKESLLDNENVTTASLNVNDKSRVIYISISFDEETNLSTAKDVAAKSLELFEEKYLKYYEFNFVIKSENASYKENIAALDKRLKDAEITQEEYDEEVKKAEYQKYHFNAIGAKNLNVDHISWSGSSNASGDN